jgi:alpha-mannosidase
MLTALGATAGTSLISAKKATRARKVYIVPNFHPASCGWLTTFSKERVYCANSYLNHLDRVRDDPHYAFVMSEVNNVIAIMNFQPQRVMELRRYLEEKRVEFVNAYFLESTINLSGGEALVRLGVEGLRWYEHVFGIRPRYSWNIDVCGTHDQMPQIASQLGLEALIYTRRNPTGKTIYWSESPDGSRILTLCPGHYSEAHVLFNAKQALTRDQLAAVNKFFESKEPITPADAPILVLAGADDYALAPAFKQYPSEFLEQWKQVKPARPVEFATLSEYVDAVLPGIRSGAIEIPTARGGTAYDFDAFWIENPKVKTSYRRNEHALQAAEMLATAASLQSQYEYPVEPFYNAWILMCLNMDRNTLWGSAGGMVFVDSGSWDVQDRFEWVERTVNEASVAAGSALLSGGNGIGLFNPLNWNRDDPQLLLLPPGKTLAGIPSEAFPDGSVLCQPRLPSSGLAGLALSDTPPAAPAVITLPEIIETKFYSARIDSKTGALLSLKFKATGREVLGGPANVIVAERPAVELKDPGDHMSIRSQRTRLGSSSDQPAVIEVKKGPVAVTVEVKGTFFGGGAIRRVMRFYEDHPRIDFETELNDVPDRTVVVSEFPLAEDVIEIRRGIPYGFSHGAWSRPNPELHGWTKGIVPAVRWIDYALANGGGVAILDRGLSGREIENRTPIIYLLNAEDKYQGYPNPWLSGKGRHVLTYALAAHETPWPGARVPQLAWEYNSLPVIVANRAPAPVQSFLETSGNVIVEAMRRERNYIELRMVECVGVAGTATVKLHLPHDTATLTDFVGRMQSALSKATEYRIPVRPQQIVTMRFETASRLPDAEPVKEWGPFVPKEKLAALHAYDPNLIGHPPFGS